MSLCVFLLPTAEVTLACQRAARNTDFRSSFGEALNLGRGFFAGHRNKHYLGKYSVYRDTF